MKRQFLPSVYVIISCGFCSNSTDISIKMCSRRKIRSRRTRLTRISSPSREPSLIMSRSQDHSVHSITVKIRFSGAGWWLTDSIRALHFINQWSSDFCCRSTWLTRGTLPVVLSASFIFRKYFFARFEKLVRLALRSRRLEFSHAIKQKWIDTFAVSFVQLSITWRT